MNRVLFTMAVLGASLVSGVFSSSLRADEWDKKTTITVDQPVTVAGIVLLPGRYVLKLVDTQSDRNVVSVSNEDETQVLATAITAAAERPQATAGPQLFFRETAKRSPEALSTWYFAGERAGLEFLPQPKTAAAAPSVPAD